MPAKAKTTPRATEAARIAEFLGISGTVTDRIALANCVFVGLSPKSAEAVRSKVGSPVFHKVVPEATYRRAVRLDRPLSRETSEKLYEFGRVYELARRIYKGDEERMTRFLERPHAMLGGRTPLQMATSSSAGADAVVDLLSRMDFGFAA